MLTDALREMSRHDKTMVLMALDVNSLLTLADRKGSKLSAVHISLAGRSGLLGYSEEDLDSELEDYVPDLAKISATCDLVAWAQETTGVQCLDLEQKTWRYR